MASIADRMTLASWFKAKTDHIIDFSDECRRGTRHSEEHFDNVLEDIDAYEKYCAAHPQFENRKAVQSIRFIVEIYDECKRKNDFI